MLIAFRSPRKIPTVTFLESCGGRETPLPSCAILHLGFIGLCYTSQLHGLLDLPCQIGGEKNTPMRDRRLAQNDGTTDLLLLWRELGSLFMA